MRRFTTVVLAGGLMLAAVPSVAQATCPGEGAAVRTAGPAAARAAVVCLVNEARTARGLVPFTSDPHLEAAAQAYAQSMQDRNFFAHTGLDGSTPDGRALAAGYQWSAVGENIAEGYATPFEVVDGWLGSTGHCSNILGSYNDIGVGATTGAYWVQDFGVQRGATAAAGGGTCPTSLGRSIVRPAAPVVNAVHTIAGARRGITFATTCADGCTATARIRATSKSGVIATVTYAVAPSVARTIRLRLSSTQDRRLRRAGRRTVRFQVVVAGRSVLSRNVTLPAAY